MMFFRLCLPFCSLLTLLHSAPISFYTEKAPDVTTTTGQLKYLWKFGYLHEELENVLEPGVVKSDTLTKAVKHFQQMAGIPQTGVIDEETVHMMKQPRCGVRDDDIPFDDTSNKTRIKRYVLHPSYWKPKSLTTGIVTYTEKMSREAVDREVQRAFQAWAEHSQLEFTQVYNRIPDITVMFARGNHGDDFPFDGPGNVLAHAFYPAFGGSVHLDADENWSDIVSQNTTNLYRVIIHEIGHSLGLKHSDVPSAIMYAYYKRSSVPGTLQLDWDDIEGIQALYGAPKQQPRITTTTTRPWVRQEATTTSRSTTPFRNRDPPGPDYCYLSKIDALTRYDDGHEYAFAGGFYYKLGKDGVIDAPRKISQRLGTIPDNIDCALYKDPVIPARSYGVMYIFKGRLVWWIAQNRLFGPQFISEVFPGLPNDLDAAFVWSGNGRTYFFKGNLYYRLSLLSRHVDEGYPKSLSIWNLSGPIDSATLDGDGNTIFFKGRQYYNYTGSVLRNSDPFPKDIAVQWFRCRNAENLKSDSEEVNKSSSTKKLSPNTIPGLGDTPIIVEDFSDEEDLEVRKTLGLLQNVMSGSQCTITLSLSFLVLLTLSLLLF